jgi:hypothetical protein
MGIVYSMHSANENRFQGGEDTFGDLPKVYMREPR